MSKRLSVLTNGLLKENPVLRLVLGTCPTLAVSTMASNGIGMGLAATFVLLCSNVVISALRKVIPDQVRIPCYITVIAGFVSVVQMLVKAYVPSLDSALGVYLPLIVVNCIILGRAEMFANKHSVLDAALDGAGMGAGFLLTLLVMASIREVFGNGTWYGMELPLLARHHVSILTMAPGGFCVFGLLIAAVNKLSRQHRRKQDELACSTCPAAAICGQQPSQEQEVADS